MKVVYKYLIDKGVLTIHLPLDAKVLHVAWDEKISLPCVWVLHDIDTTKTEPRVFEIATTGEPLSYNPSQYIVEYVGTYMTRGSQFVGHIFEIKTAPSGDEGMK